jgi:lysine biosynthesis protein LysW
MKSTECPYCGVEIGWSEKPKLNQIVSCYVCKGRSNVTSVEPVELDEINWDYTETTNQVNRKRVRSAKVSFEEYADDEDLEPVNQFRRTKGKRPSRGNIQLDRRKLNWG